MAPAPPAKAAPALKPKLFINGAPVADTVTSQLTELVLDDSVTLPDMLDLTFADFNAGFLEAHRFKIGVKVKLELAAPGQKATTFEGECVSLGASLHGGRTFATLRAFDISHRLNRGRMTMTFEKMTAADMFKKIAGEAGVPCGTVEPTTVTFESLSMVNEVPIDFLCRLAAEHGLEATAAENKMHLRKPEATEAPITLSVGESLLALDVEISAADQVKDLTAAGWDPKKKEQVVGKAAVATKAAKAPTLAPGTIAQKMGTTKPLVIADRAVDQQAHATAIAKATAEQHGGAFVDIRGTASGNTGLRAGTSIKLEGVGKDLKDVYRLSSTRHIWNQKGGYITEFTVSGQSDRSLGGLVAGAAGAPQARTISGVVTGIVTDNKDPSDWGRIKVALPWLDSKHVSGWARVVYPGAGKDRGITFVPEVNDEVYVAFEHGDPDRLIVLGGVYNGKDKFPDHKGGGVHFDRGKTVHYGLFTDKGKLTISDKQGAEEITLGLRDKSYIITIDKKGTVLSIGSDGKVDIKAKAGVTITAAQGNIELSAKTGDVKIGGMNVTVEGKAGLTLSATGPAKLKGATVAIG